PTLPLRLQEAPGDEKTVLRSRPQPSPLIKCRAAQWPQRPRPCKDRPTAELGNDRGSILPNSSDSRAPPPLRPTPPLNAAADGSVYDLEHPLTAFGRNSSSDPEIGVSQAPSKAISPAAPQSNSTPPSDKFERNRP